MREFIELPYRLHSNADQWVPPLRVERWHFLHPRTGAFYKRGEAELFLARNIRPSFRFGLFGGLAYSGLDAYVLRGRAPWTMHHHPDHTRLKPAREFQPIAYPRPDGKLSFDRLSSVYISNTNHDDDQPCHLQLLDP